MDIRIPNGILSVGGKWKPGDLPPSGYNDWHEWAAVQAKAGIKQGLCDLCGKWKFPQEHAGSECEARGGKIESQPSWPCECQKRDEAGSLTHIKMHTWSKRKCKECGAENPYR